MGTFCNSLNREYYDYTYAFNNVLLSLAYIGGFLSKSKPSMMVGVRSIREFYRFCKISLFILSLNKMLSSVI